MKREQLDHVLRAASRIAPSSTLLVIGSQSVLASFSEDQLPHAATASMEVDVAFFDDPGDRQSDLVDGAIGELSPFHQTFGYYAHGVGVRTALLPRGWQERLVPVRATTTAGRSLCLEPHDCVAAKLAACREKDFAFAVALVDAGLIDVDVLGERISSLDVDTRVTQRLRGWLDHQRRSPHSPGS